VAQFHRRLQVYKRHWDHVVFETSVSESGRNFVQKEVRCQWLLEKYCDMCARVQESGLSARSKQAFL